MNSLNLWDLSTLTIDSCGNSSFRFLRGKSSFLWTTTIDNLILRRLIWSCSLQNPYAILIASMTHARVRCSVQLDSSGLISLGQYISEPVPLRPINIRPRTSPGYMYISFLFLLNLVTCINTRTLSFISMDLCPTPNYITRLHVCAEFYFEIQCNYERSILYYIV